MNSIPAVAYCCHKCSAIFPHRVELKNHMADKHPSRQVDPLVASVKRVRREWRKTPPGKLQSLLDEQSKWKRRQTIADNKLAQVRKEIECLARELAEKAK